MTYPPMDTVAGLPVATARCCRDWPVLPWASMGRCGLCGNHPVIVPRSAR